MKRTLALAARGRGMTSPNPMVGALVVRNGRIIAEGYHRKAGTPHAEVVAIDLAGEKARGGTLFVSLEPCCHKDKRTPPCTQKIIAAGMKKVMIAMEDPNPKVAGKGIEELRRAGIQVVSGILEAKARKLNEFYIKYITTGMPYVIMKVAMTLDGKIATPEGESKWITGVQARNAVQRLRAETDAVMTAIGTVKADDPRLTCRTRKGKDPVRIIIDPELEVSPDAAVMCAPPRTILVCSRRREVTALASQRSEREEKRTLLLKKGITIIDSDGEKVDLAALMKEVGKMGIISVLIEGGSSLNAYSLESGIVDKIMFFIAPKIIGGKASFPAVGGSTFRRLSDAYSVKDMKVKRMGGDILIEGYL